MAKKNQCLKCCRFNESNDLCTKLWTQPTYDGTECNSYSAESHQSPANQNPQVKNTPNVVGVRRRKDAISLTAPDKHSVHKSETTKRQEDSEKIINLDVPRLIYRNYKYLKGFFVLIFMIGLFYVGNYVYKNYHERENEEAILLVQSYLSEIQSNKLAEFSKIRSHYYANDTLYISFEFSKNHEIGKKSIVDYRLEDDFMAIVAITPTAWKEIFKILSDSKINLSLAMPTDEKSLKLSCDSLLTWVNDTKRIQKGNYCFVFYKMQEVLDYARIHFANDGVFDVIGYSANKDSVILNLSFYDKNLNLSESFYNKKGVPLHFLDKVGNMGSILDGMLLICSRQGSGLGFSYEGKTNHKKYSCYWSADEVPELVKKYGRIINNDKQETNQVKTTIVTQSK